MFNQAIQQKSILLNIKEMRLRSSERFSVAQISLPLHKDRKQSTNQIVTVFFVFTTGQKGDSPISVVYIFAAAKM